MVLTEARRNQFLNNSKNVEREADGKTRYEKRLKSSIAPSNTSYNKIDMNLLFKEDVLDVEIPVTGETNSYFVTIRISGVLQELQKMITPDTPFNFRVVLRALVKAFNSSDVYIRCTCEDFRYRFAYWASKNDLITGEKENRPANITNPNNTKGDGCKHIMLVLSNTNWAIKVASVIKNYTTYVEKHYQKLYADVIYPALYGIEYPDDVQLQFDDQQDEREVIDSANKEARIRNRWTKETAPRWVPRTQQTNDEQTTLDAD